MSDLLKAIKNSLSSDTPQNITLSSHKAPKSLSSKLPETSLWLGLSSFLLDLLFDIWPLGCKTLALSSWNVTGASCQLPDISAWHTILLLCATRQKTEGSGLALNSACIKDGRQSWVLPTTKQKGSLFWRSRQPLPGGFSAYTKYITCYSAVGTVLKRSLNKPQKPSQHNCSAFVSDAGLIKGWVFSACGDPIQQLTELVQMGKWYHVALQGATWPSHIDQEWHYCAGGEAVTSFLFCTTCLKFATKCLSSVELTREKRGLSEPWQGCHEMTGIIGIHFK